MTATITRCPKCRTSFRLPDEILNSARGSVRCGSCLFIFNAKEHLIQAQEEQEDRLAAEAPLEAEDDQASAATVNDDDDMLIHDDAAFDSEQDEGDNYSDFDSNVFVSNHSTSAETNLFERSEQSSEKDLSDNDTDESWAESLLLDDDPQEDKIANAAPASKLSRTNIFQIIEDVDDNVTDDHDEHAHTSKQDEATQSFHEALDSEVFDEGITDEIADDITDNIADHIDDDLGDPFDDGLDDNFDESFDAKHDFFDTLEPEPLELRVPRNLPIWHQSWFWFSLSTLAALILMFQIAYFNADSFARKSGLRPYYARACAIFDCKLPELTDLTKVQVRNLVVVDHPRKQASLLVDASLINQAKFEQAFPSLKIAFANIDNEIVSSQLLPPARYVGGELAGKRNMPPQTPIHISFEIPDPGKHAVNYQITIVKP